MILCPADLLECVRQMSDNEVIELCKLMSRPFVVEKVNEFHEENKRNEARTSIPRPSVCDELDAIRHKLSNTCPVCKKQMYYQNDNLRYICECGFKTGVYQ